MGYCRKKRLTERSQIFQGMVDGLLEQRKWQEVVQLVYGDSPTRLLYDGDKTELDQRIKQAISPADFEKRGYDGMNLLVKAGKIEMLCETALREDFPLEVAEKLLSQLAKPDDDLWKEGLDTLAQRIEQTSPDKAYEIYQRTQNSPAIQKLYHSLLGDFAPSHFNLMRQMTQKLPYGERATQATQLVKKMLDQPKEKWAPESLGLYRLIQDNSISWDKVPNKKELEQEVGKEIPYDVEKYPFVIQVEWAKHNWEKSPIKAYAIFNDHLTEEYKGPENLECAKAILAMRKNVDLQVNLKPKHMQALYEDTPLEDLDQRIFLARRLGDKEELWRQSAIFSEQKNWQIAYGLLSESDSLDRNQKYSDTLRRKIIQEALTQARQHDYFPYLDLALNDHRGWAMAYEKTINKFPTKAYGIAKQLGDEEKLARVRTRIFEKNALEITAKFFKRNEDQIGYQRSVELLAVKYELPREDILSLVAKM